MGSLLVLLSSAPARAERPDELGISWQRDKNSPHWVHGMVDVSAAPAEVWRRLQPVADWPKIFTDIKWLSVKQRAKSNIRVRLETRTFTCGAHDYVIAMDPATQTGTLEIDAPGVDSRARLIVRKGAREGQANIAYSLYVKATGVVGWFISEEALHQKQEQMVQRYLRDLENAFGKGG
jgi:hypothetical protein